jgi:hypothetical protein
VAPDAARHAIYHDFMRAYAAREVEALTSLREPS